MGVGWRRGLVGWGEGDRFDHRRSCRIPLAPRELWFGLASHCFDWRIDPNRLPFISGIEYPVQQTGAWFAFLSSTLLYCFSFSVAIFWLGWQAWQRDCHRGASCPIGRRPAIAFGSACMTLSVASSRHASKAPRAGRQQPPKKAYQHEVRLCSSLQLPQQFNNIPTGFVIRVQARVC